MPDRQTPILGRRIRIAVTACGRISSNHFNSIETHRESIELVGVCDINRTVLHAAQSAHGVPGYDSLERLLQKSAPDLVALCTPNGLHPKQTIHVARTGRHVMTEKGLTSLELLIASYVSARDGRGVALPLEF